MPENQNFTQSIFYDTKKYIFPASLIIDIDFNSLKEYEKITGVYFSTEKPSMYNSKVSLDIDSQVVLKNNLIEESTFKLIDDARSVREIIFPLTVKANGSSVVLRIEGDAVNINANDVIYMTLIYENKFKN